jgi:predicted SAM-dependent methyltransferase
VTQEGIQTEQLPVGPGGVRRLNWGCGDWTERGWINSDVKEFPGVDLVADIREGLPLESDSVDYIASIHSLPEIRFTEIVPALTELRRILKPGGVLRLVLPDLDKGISAYQRRDAEYFKVPDEDARSLGAKFVTQMVWYGYSKSLFTYEFIEEQLQKAGFSRVANCAFKQTVSPYAEIVELDNRERESLFVEAVK